MPFPESIQHALSLPRGARFIRAALQVNPFPYLAKVGKASQFSDETSYNTAIVDACKRNEIEVIGVTDHHCVSSAAGLIAVAKEAGISVFPGFEAMAKDGVHILCLFDPSTGPEMLGRYLGACGIHRKADEAQPGELDTGELLERAHAWGAVTIAAHVVNPGGLLKVLQGQPRISAWQSEHLLAVAIPGRVEGVFQQHRGILTNTDPAYRREHPVAIINATDVSSPEDLEAPGAWCWIKMLSPTIDGLRHAFLDPGSRIRLGSDPTPNEHTELVAITWQGGFLDGSAVRFNENLNVLIGGRGTGKSTVIESVRYVLDVEPLGDAARTTHEGFVRNVLKSGTTVSLLIRSPNPSTRFYLIERTVPGTPVVRDEQGVRLAITPADVIPHIEIYGQHEVAELARHPERRARLLERFITHDPTTAAKAATARRSMEQVRSRIVDLDRELVAIDEQLAGLPGLQERLARFEEAGLEGRLKAQSGFATEEALLKAAKGRVQTFSEVAERLRTSLPIDRAFLGPDAVAPLASKDLLGAAGTALADLDRELDDIARRLEQAVATAVDRLDEVDAGWEARRQAAADDYQKVLRSLQGSNIDGEEFIALRRRIEDLRLLAEGRAELAQDRAVQEEARQTQLRTWRKLHAQEFDLLGRAAKTVSKRLHDQVRARVTFEGDREPLIRFLDAEIGGRLDKVRERLRAVPALALADLTQACRDGAEALVQRFGISPGQADRLAAASPAMLMQLEELELGPTVEIELNVAPPGADAVWRSLDQLSTGQKATALLLLLLLQSDDPLVIDQPEDDLDNAFITDGIVPRIRDAKQQRQFLLSTHNANLPVLGDAEAMVVLRAHGEADAGGRGAVDPGEIGSIDAPRVRALIEQLLEGGRLAFEQRRRKYKF